MMKKILAGLVGGVALVTLLLSPSVAQEPVYGGTVVASVDHQVRSLDPIMGDANTGDRRVFNAMFEPLLRVAADGSLEPVLATSWEVAADGLSVTFQLREGVTFHDGTPFNAEAVVFNLERVLNPDTVSPRVQDVNNIASVEAVDEVTVRVNLKAASATTLPLLGAEGGYMVSPTAMETHGEDFARNPVGTGPFKFVDWPGGERLNLVRNETYWGKDEAGNQLPYLDELVIRTIRQASVAMLELEAGTVQLAVNVPIREADRLAAGTNHVIVDSPYMAYLMVALNTSTAPFDNKLVRQALAHAFDREQLAAVAGLGRGAVLPIFITENDSMYDGEVEGYSYDPEEARRLLAEAGHEGLTFTLSVIQREPDAQVAQVMQAQAQASGINLVLDVGDRQTIVDKMSKTFTHEGALIRAGIPALDVAQTFNFYFADGAPQNYSRQNDPEVFRLVAAAEQEVDPAKRQTLYTELSRKLLDESYFLYLAGYPFLSVADTRLQGLEVDMIGVWLFDELWLAQE